MQKKPQVPSVINVGFRKSYSKVYLKGVCLVMSATYRLSPSVKFSREKAVILGSGNRSTRTRWIFSMKEARQHLPFIGI